MTAIMAETYLRIELTRARAKAEALQALLDEANARIKRFEDETSQLLAACGAGYGLVRPYPQIVSSVTKLSRLIAPVEEHGVPVKPHHYTNTVRRQLNDEEEEL